MTYWWSNDNYGQILQCYALQKYLRDAGHDAFLIRYRYGNDYESIPTPLFKKILKIFNPIKLFRFVLSKILHKYRMSYIAQERQNNEKRCFDDFRNKHIKVSETIYRYYAELKENPPKADMYIVGSDQVWNPDLYASIERQSRAFFLDFGHPEVKRISYAASICKEDLDIKFINIIKPLLKKFDYISVREKSGLNLCKQCEIDNAEWVPDPTMLLDADAYRSLYKNETFVKPEKPYCLFYFLGNNNIFSIQKIYDWAKKKNIEVLYIPAKMPINKYNKTYATIPQWIYLLEHAEYVITNSYHCAVFSIIFNRKFGIIPLLNMQAVMNRRFETLFELFKIEKRFIIDLDFKILDKDIDRNIISEKLQIIKSNCKLIDLISK